MVRLESHGFADDRGPFLGLAASYFTALQRCRQDRARLESDLAFLAAQGFNSYRMFSMVGHNASWSGLEIAPVSFTSREGRRVEAWPDYVDQFRTLIDLAFDKYGLRTEITVFADAQLMPEKTARLAHLDRLLAEVLPGREHRILLIEVANEAWQNGFPGDAGVAELRGLAKHLNERTEILVAISSNHGGPGSGDLTGFDQLHAGGVADLATWHFSRDRRADAGWRPVFDCWELGGRPGAPPVCSNEPIGPGASVNSEPDPVKLVMAAAFAWTARLPLYVFHSEAGVHGRTGFEDTPSIRQFQSVTRLLPADLPAWPRNDGLSAAAPFTVHCGGKTNHYWSEEKDGGDGCVRNIGGRKDDHFVCLPIGIRPAGLKVTARQPMAFTAFDPLTGSPLTSATLASGETRTLPAGPGALIVTGRILPEGK
ncbi:MAG: hypothetical protein JWM59_3653 [Verrucomicrobiales bacterium]|nr:hypothetical protein [Verrucomicrobiales bacterium]